jgi:hypothetical protein
MKTVFVRYKVKAEWADENQRLIEQVFAQLARDRPTGLHYQSFRSADGLSFVHVATRADPEQSQLAQLESFKAFIAGIKDRCSEAPVQTEVEIVGRYDALTALSPGSL